MDAATSRPAVPAGPETHTADARRAVPPLVAPPHDRCDERDMLWAAMTAIAAVGPFAAEAAYALDQGPPRRCPPPHAVGSGTSVRSGDAEQRAAAATPADADRLDRSMAALDGHSQHLDHLDGPGLRAIALRHRGRCFGYLVVRILATPSDQEIANADLVARQAAAALAALTLCRDRYRPPSSVGDTGLGGTVFRLAAASAFHEALARAAASGAGEEGILRTLHEHTGFPALSEDVFGNLRNRVGPGHGGPGSALEARRRVELAQTERRGPGAVRDRDRLLVPIRMAGDLLGLVSLVDPDLRSTEADIAALEQTALVLAPELAHERRLAELQPRLRHDLVEKLISGTATDDAFVQAARLGHDLHRPHRVALLQWPNTVERAAVGDAVERAARRLRLDALPGSRGAITVVLLAGRDTGGEGLYQAVADELGTDRGAIGIGGLCEVSADLPHSYEEAARALSVRLRSHEPHGSTSFAELGLCRMMGAGDGEREADRFVSQWLGPLLEYDAHHHTELTATLSHYLESGGSYDATSEALHIHRSTVRYRLQRIRDITGHDLGNVDTRLNLHVASRIHQVLARPR
ncbi:PucR family transcriptional regulator [Streptomyces albipurpureus]|uniref:Helix-turn-helix domain-containing protein n=1 Tax=Streptomyces albipurpureus TaxID=2897419 RepID=A0ABT0UPQ9_9ACTN|nr:helix-turn-helix domain-containing protein [Streptomyces sp. CWNU-1]MCM2390528.1 helix-turn-helix domain-containing protein [Streptomyces sp. CWNU-1]